MSDTFARRWEPIARLSSQRFVRYRLRNVLLEALISEKKETHEDQSLAKTCLQYPQVSYGLPQIVLPLQRSYALQDHVLKARKTWGDSSRHRAFLAWRRYTTPQKQK